MSARFAGMPAWASFASLVLLAGLAAPGCKPQQKAIAAGEPTAVPISKPVQREVTDFVDFTGRANAVETVNIIPRVTGYLVQIPFQEGADVKAGDVLFEIDPRPYQAQLDQALGQVDLYKAQLRLAEITLARDREVAKSAGAISQQQIDQDEAAVNEAQARLKAYQASTEVYRLNMDFTKVRSPINGRIGRHYLTMGNLVNQDQTLLATVVSLDPMYVYFDMDEVALLRIRRAINEGRMKRRGVGNIPVSMGLQGEEGYPHEGTVDFINNQVNPGTGSISVRGRFDNPDPPNGIRLLSPGMFVRIRLPIGLPYQALLVIDRAITSDQGFKFVYVVDGESKVQTRRITTGALQADGLRVVMDGLKPDDQVVVGGLQQVQPKMKVKTEETPMPSFGSGSEAAVAAAETDTAGGKEAAGPAASGTAPKASGTSAGVNQPTPPSASDSATGQSTNR